MHCGARLAGPLQHYCSACGTPAPSQSGVVPVVPGTVVKGRLVTNLSPPFWPGERFRDVTLAAGAAIVLLMAVSNWLGWTEVTSYSTLPLIAGGILLWLRVGVVLNSVRVYDNGLERDIPRRRTLIPSVRRSWYLPWDQVEGYRWDGDILNYSWRAGGLTLLKDGKSSDSRRVYNFSDFPSRLRVPAERAGSIRDLLARTKVPCLPPADLPD